MLKRIVAFGLAIAMALFVGPIQAYAIDRLDGTGIVAVCADSEQEAQEQYQWFLSEKVRDN